MKFMASMRYYKKWMRNISWILSFFMVLSSVSPVFAAEICDGSYASDDLANLPLEIIGGSSRVPGLFMISLDNSDSMKFEVMTDNVLPDHDFVMPVTGIKKQYLFSSAGGPADVNIARAWQSQFYKFNKMYYNPYVGNNNEYKPWPTKANVNVDNPPWDPQTLAGATYPLTGAWLTGYVAREIPPEEPPADPDPPTIIDDSTGPFSKGGSCTWTHSADGYNSSSEVASGKNKTFTATWGYVSVDPEQAYNISIYRKIADVSATVTLDDGAALSPTYTVAAGVSADYWTNVASNIKFPGGQAKITISGSIGNSTTRQISADAVRLTPAANDITTLYWSLTSKTIKNRHFYIQSSNGAIYLVNLVSADSAEFYFLHELPWGGGLADNNLLDWFVQGYPELIVKDYSDLPSDLKTANGGPLPPPGAGAYTNHLQNFANWFTFYRTRRAVAQNAVAVMVTEMKNMLVGFVTSPPAAGHKHPVTWINTDFIDCNGDPVHYDNTGIFLNNLYNLPAPQSARGFSEDITDLGDYFSGGTNLLNALEKALLTANPPDAICPLGKYAIDGKAEGTYPFFTENYGGNCQQAFALIITDGASPSTAEIKNYDGTSTYGNSIYDEGIFGDAFNKTAADGAMQYYEEDLRPVLEDNVPTNYIDINNTQQHMVTYGLSFGVRGPMQKANPDFDARCADNTRNNICTGDLCPGPVWKDPSAADFDVLDDLWHATINGRGLFLYADNPQEMITKLREIAGDIERRQGSAAAVTTNAVQRQIGATIYQGTYHSGYWWGDLIARAVNVTNGALGVTLWSAGELLKDKYYLDRDIFTSDGTNAMDFNAGNAGSFGLTADVVSYLLGYHGDEGPAAPAFRERGVGDPTKPNERYVLGDIVHSEPFYFDRVIYVGANDGMMHAFDADNGQELFGYVPSMLHSSLGYLTQQDYLEKHRYYVNASPHVAKEGSASYLACGLGKGGKGVFSLNVLNWNTTPPPTPTAASIFNWEYTESTDVNGSKLGYVYGRAYVVATNATSGTPAARVPAVIFGNGYASADKTSVLFIRNADTGAEIRTFDTGDTGGGCNGMSSPSLIDSNFDGAVDYVFVGDLGGNLWKFDLRDTDPAKWTISYGGKPMITVKDSDGKRQPITSEPDVMRHCDLSRKGFVVIFGTGRYLNEDDLTSNVASEAMYGIYDWEADWLRTATPPADLSTIAFGTFQPGVGLSISSPAVSLLKQEYVKDLTGDFEQTTDFPINYYNPIGGAGEHVGWYFPLPDSSERVVRDPIIRNEVVYFVSNTQGGGICSSVGGSYVNALDACSGGIPAKPQFDTNGDRKVDGNDVINDVNPSREYFDTTLFDPVALADLLYINDTFGNIVEHPIEPDPPGGRYWLMNQ